MMDDFGNMLHFTSLWQASTFGYYGWCRHIYGLIDFNELH